MIKWEKYFDKIICVHFNQKKLRKQLLDYQLKRVGILNSPIFKWYITFNDIYEQNFKLALPSERAHHMDFHRFSCTKGHIDAIKQAYEEGANKVLIIEDDIRFLKDLNKMELILQNIPDQKYWQIILFDKFLARNVIAYYNMINDKKNIVNKHYCKFNKNLILYGASCYCLNRKGMKLILDLYNAYHFIINDWYWNDDWTKSLFTQRLFSIQNLGVQISFSKASNITISRLQKETLNFIYKKQQINFDNYMMRKDGSPYYYGDWIEE